VPLVIAGHSHSEALGVPSGRADGRTELVAHPDDARLACAAGVSPRDERYWEDLARLSVTHAVGIVWRGNQHYANCMFAPTPPFDLAIAARPDLPVDDTAVAVPELTMRAWIAPSLTGLADLLTRIEAAGGPAPAVLGTPPPKNTEDGIREKRSTEPFFVDLAKSAGVDLFTVPLSPPVLHLKLWLLIQDMTGALAESFGVPFCPSPPDARTAQGFLREDLWHDVTHANRAYGRLMLRDVARQLCLDAVGAAA
jgi:hypothetical protein